MSGTSKMFGDWCNRLMLATQPTDAVWLLQGETNSEEREETMRLIDLVAESLRKQYTEIVGQLPGSQPTTLESFRYAMEFTLEYWSRLFPDHEASLRQSAAPFQVMAEAPDADFEEIETEFEETLLSFLDGKTRISPAEAMHIISQQAECHDLAVFLLNEIDQGKNALLPWVRVRVLFSPEENQE